MPGYITASYNKFFPLADITNVTVMPGAESNLPLGISFTFRLASSLELYIYQVTFVSTWDVNHVNVSSRRTQAVTLRRKGDLAICSSPQCDFYSGDTSFLYKKGSLIPYLRIAGVLICKKCVWWLFVVKRFNWGMKRRCHIGSLFPFHVYFYKQHVRTWLFPYQWPRAGLCNL